ncbi:10589_t:CDS:2 [Ambispora leptoticha]|uniref:10589_t:CDS:1 n=1 Tax=Ambispora leptoticha TaxID=144679 RepID=A0A9N9ALK9_9GLOM|nr:10589_t:CDS:2 [Ambispora leptoticha]
MSIWLWVLLEGQDVPVEMDASDIPNLSRLIPRIKEAFPELSTREDTIFVQRQPWFRQRWPHSSGLWHLVRATVLEHFSSLNSSESFFVVKDPVEEIISEFQFNRVIQKAPTDNNNERQISISIQVKGKKAYGEWDLRDVLQNILHKLIDELQKNADVFGEVTRNEMTCREFISPFLTTAVKHLQENEPLLALRAEEELNGSRGFGPIDYSVVLNDIVTCVTEAKKMDFDKGAAQNIVQMHSVVENLRKRKIEDTDLEDSEEVPVMVYGIVSDARNWRFLQWAGTENDPVLYVSKMQSCNFSDTEIMKAEAKKITTYIIAILQEQIRGLNTERRRVPKKPKLSF